MISSHSIYYNGVRGNLIKNVQEEIQLEPNESRLLSALNVKGNVPNVAQMYYLYYLLLQLCRNTCE